MVSDVLKNEGNFMPLRTVEESNVLPCWQELTRQLQVHREKIHELLEKREELVSVYLKQYQDKFARVRVCINEYNWEEASQMPSPFEDYYYFNERFFKQEGVWPGGPKVTGPVDTPYQYEFIECITQ